MIKLSNQLFTEKQLELLRNDPISLYDYFIPFEEKLTQFWEDFIAGKVASTVIWPKGEFPEQGSLPFELYISPVWFDSKNDDYYKYLTEVLDEIVWTQFFDRTSLYTKNSGLMSYERIKLPDLVERRKEIYNNYMKEAKNKPSFKEQSFDEFMKSFWNKKWLKLLKNPKLYLEDFYLYLLDEGEPYAFSISTDFSSKAQDIIKKFDVKSNFEYISFEIRLKGPILAKIPVKEDEENSIDQFIMPFLNPFPFIESPIIKKDDLDHPYIIFNKDVQVSRFETILWFTIEISTKESFSSVIKEIIEEMKQIKVFTKDKNKYAIDYDLYPNFEQWITSRLEEKQTQEKVNYLYPMLTSKEFLKRLDEFERLGNEIVSQTKSLKEAIKSLVNSPSHDIIQIKEILKEEKIELSREEILDMWSELMKEKGDTHSKKYLKKTVLSSRFNKAIEEIKANPTKHYEVELSTAATGGKPKLTLKWKQIT